MGRGAIYLRAHHSLMDGSHGVSLVRLLLDESARPSTSWSARRWVVEPSGRLVPVLGSRRRPGTVSVDDRFCRAVVHPIANGVAWGGGGVRIDPVDAVVRGVQRGLDVANSISRQVVVTGGRLSPLCRRIDFQWVRGVVGAGGAVHGAGSWGESQRFVGRGGSGWSRAVSRSFGVGLSGAASGVSGALAQWGGWWWFGGADSGGDPGRKRASWAAVRCCCRAVGQGPSGAGAARDRGAGVGDEPSAGSRAGVGDAVAGQFGRFRRHLAARHPRRSPHLWCGDRREFPVRPTARFADEHHRFRCRRSARHWDRSGSRCDRRAARCSSSASSRPSTASQGRMARDSRRTDAPAPSRPGLLGSLLDDANAVLQVGGQRGRTGGCQCDRRR